MKTLKRGRSNDGNSIPYGACVNLVENDVCHAATPPPPPPKRPSKMQRLSGLLREVVVYKNRIAMGLFREEVRAHLLYGG